MTEQKVKKGRRPKLPHEVRSHKVTVRFTPQVRLLIDCFAELYNLTATRFIVNCMIWAIRQDTDPERNWGDSEEDKYYLPKTFDRKALDRIAVEREREGNIVGPPANRKSCAMLLRLDGAEILSLDATLQKLKLIRSAFIVDSVAVYIKYANMKTRSTMENTNNGRDKEKKE